MRKVLVACIVTAFLVGSVRCGAQGGDQQVSPPPVGTAEVFSGVLDMNIRAMYMSMADLDGGGANVQWTRGLTEKFGLGAAVGVMGMSGDISTGVGGDSSFDMLMVPIGINAMLELFGGSELDAAGVITERRPTVSLFAGVQANLMMFDMEIDTGRYRSSTTEEEVYFYVQGGGIADIPLLDWLSIQPFGAVMGGETTIVSYGADIVLRPFGNDSNWEISVGTVLQQIDANDEDSTFIMAGVSYTAGQSFRRVSAGPVLK